MNETTNYTPARSATRKSTWCGPYALAVVSLQDYDTAYKRLLRVVNRDRRKRRRTPRTHLTGVVNREMELALKTFRTPATFQPAPRVTLAALLDHLKPGALYIVNVTGHYVVIDTARWLIIDNQGATWQPIEQCRHRRCMAVAFAKIGKAATARFQQAGKSA